MWSALLPSIFADDDDDDDDCDESLLVGLPLKFPRIWRFVAVRQLLRAGRCTVWERGERDITMLVSFWFLSCCRVGLLDVKTVDVILMISQWCQQELQYQQIQSFIPMLEIDRETTVLYTIAILEQQQHRDKQGEEETFRSK